MKIRGQGAVAVIVGIVVIVGLLGVIAWSFTPGITGRAIVEDSEEETIEVQTSNYLTEPFQLTAWVVNEEGAKLNIKNVGGEVFVVKSIEVEGCGKREFDVELRNMNSEIFDVDCPLSTGQSLIGAIVVEYTNENEVVVKKSFGNLDDFA